MKLYLKNCEHFHWPFDDASSISFLTMKMELFQKKINADHWRPLQAICACSQICNWFTWCLEIPPNC